MLNTLITIPTNMFRMNRDPTTMNRIKKKIEFYLLFLIGCMSISLESTALHITPIQPSVVITLKRVIIELTTLSKF